jgi:CheY-like chemotaxis protein
MYLPDLRQPTDSTGVVTGRGTLLLVDDNDAFRNVIRVFLESAGYDVLEAGTASEASAIVSSHVGTIDLVLTDVVLPGVNRGPALRLPEIPFPQTHCAVHVRIRKRREVRQRRLAGRCAHAAEALFEEDPAAGSWSDFALERAPHREGHSAPGMERNLEFGAIAGINSSDRHNPRSIPHSVPVLLR